MQDWDSLKVIPPLSVLQFHAAKSALELGPAGKGRDGYLEKLRGMPEHEQRLHLLSVLLPQSASQGFGTFFFVWDGDVAPEIRDAMVAAGLKRNAEFFGQAIALFGQPYPLPYSMRDSFTGTNTINRLMSGQYNPDAKPNALDERLSAIAMEFNSAQDYSKAVERLLLEDREAADSITSMRDKLPDGERLWTIFRRRIDAIDTTTSSEELARQLSAIPPPYRTIFPLFHFQGELASGGLGTFFSNSAGALAPDIPDALRAIGRAEDARAVERAIALFGVSYPRDRRARDQAFVASRGRLDRALNNIKVHSSKTGFDLEAIEVAMVAYARQNNILPY